MAEETTIPLDGGSSGSSAHEGLESTGDNGHAAGGAPEEHATVEALRQERDNLQQQAEQYKRERQGWETQSRRNLEDRNALAERLARIEGQLSQGSGNAPAPAEALPPYTPGQFKTAMRQWWLDGDEDALDTAAQVFERAVGKPADNTDIEQRIDARLTQTLQRLGTQANVQTIVGARHPDMGDVGSPLYRAVWEQYDTYATDPSTQLLYTKDPDREVPMTGPDGNQKTVDARIVDRLAAELRLSGTIAEGQRQEQVAAQRGTVSGGYGQQSRTPRNRTVEAVELLTPGEQSLLADPRVRKGWPGMPADPKAAAKFFYDALEPTERARRLDAYRRGGR